MAAYVILAVVVAVIVIVFAYKVWIRHFPHVHGHAKQQADKRILNKKNESYHVHSEYPKVHVTAEDVLTKAGIRARPAFLSPLENTFYAFLEKKYGKTYNVSCKVQSSKLFSYNTNAVKKAANSWGKKFYKIYYSRCVDYVLFLRDDPAFFFAVQFRNNSSANEEVRARREKNMLGLFKAADLPYYLADPARYEKDPAACQKELDAALIEALKAWQDKKARDGDAPKLPVSESSTPANPDDKA